MTTRVKICCIESREEAQLAIAHGAAAIGLVSHMPSGPGVIPETRITEIAEASPPAVGTFLLTSLQDADAIVAQRARCRVNTVQLCDRLTSGDLASLCRALPGVSIVQVIHITGEEAVEEAMEAAPHVHALLLDSGNPNLTVKSLGGTGRRHDWSISRRIRERAGVPVFLAGGLRPGNVAEAIRTVQPYGVDVCTGVRTDGRLDASKLARFVSQVRAA